MNLKINNVVSQIRTTNMDQSLDFYINTLGFELRFKYEDFYAGINAGNCSFHIKLVDEKDPSIDFVSSGDHFHLYFEVEGVHEAANELKRKGIVLLKEVSETPWGTKEFVINDDQGHVLYFGQNV